MVRINFPYLVNANLLINMNACGLFLHAATRKNREKKRTASLMMLQSFEPEKNHRLSHRLVQTTSGRPLLQQGAIAYHLNSRFNDQL